MSALWLQPQAEVSNIRNVAKYFLRSAVIFFLIYHSTSNANTVPPIPAPSINVPLFSCNARIGAWCGPPSYIVSVDSTSTTVVAPIGVISAACAAIGSGYVESLLPGTPAYQQNYWCNIPASAGGNYYTQTNQAHPEPTSCPAGYVWNGSTVLCDPLGPPTCPTGYELGGSAPNWTCTSTCPIDRLPDLPKDDLCTQSLEAGRGKDVNHACGSLTPEMQNQAQCLADKIHALGLAYTGPSATIRTEAYQNHLLAVWKKSEEITNKDLTDAEKQACAARIADVDNEMNRHGIDSEPSSKGSQAPHVQGRAVDIPKSVTKALKKQVTNTTFITVPSCLFCIPFAVTVIGDVQDYVTSTTVHPPACNLDWGGRFTTTDPVHFQLL